MRDYFRYLSICLCLALAIPLTVQAAGKKTSPLLASKPELRSLLQQEMQALQQALATISQALPEGDWPRVASTAKQMHDSFIFQQQLTTEDRETLHSILPEEFIRQDRAFHQLASKLHRAATRHDTELSLFYYSNVVESCVACHSQFATHRFPSLSGSTPAEAGH